MKSTPGVALAICLTFCTAILSAQGSPQILSPDQLDNLMAPVALYPDPLLAQILTAATYADQVDEAAHRLHGRRDSQLIDNQSWDVSVKSVAHYPGVLSMMSSKLDWTTSVGQAYVNQPGDVMAAIQRLRVMARNQGNLVSNQQQEVIVNGDYISIDPFQPQYIYVPAYDPSVVYYRRGVNFLSFGTGFAIGAWLNYDFNWGHHGIFYHGWGAREGGWIGRSRSFAGSSNIYINNSYTNIQVNRTVVNRRVDYSNLNRDNTVHNTVKYENPVAGNRGRPGGATPAATPARPPQQTAAARPAPTPATARRPGEKPSAMDPRTNSQRNAANRQAPQPKPGPVQQPTGPRQQQAQRQHPPARPQAGAPQAKQPQQAKQQQPQKAPTQQHAQAKPPEHKPEEHREKP